MSYMVVGGGGGRDIFSKVPLLMKISFIFLFIVSIKTKLNLTFSFLRPKIAFSWTNSTLFNYRHPATPGFFP